MPTTPFTNISYPNQDDDPWYDEFVATMDEIDQQVYGLLSSACNIIIPPSPTGFYPFSSSGFIYDNSAQQIQWHSNFVIPILGSGGQFIIPAGVLSVSDGQLVVVTVPLTAGVSTVTGSFQAVTGKVAYQNGLFVFGMRYNNVFYANLPSVVLGPS